MVEKKKENVNFFEQFYVAMFHWSGYKRLLEEKTGRHVLYVIGIAFLTMLMTFMVPAVSFIISIGGFENFFMNRIPQFQIENGQMQIEEPLDFRLNGVHIIVDDSIDEFQNEDIVSENAVVMFMGKKNIVMNSAGIPVSFTYAQFLTDRLDNKILASEAGTFYAAFAMTAVVQWIVNGCGFLIFALLMTLVGQMQNKLYQSNLPYGKLYAAALYAATFFVIVTNLLPYFVKGLFETILYFIAIMVSMRALSNAILSYSTIIPGGPNGEL